MKKNNKCNCGEHTKENKCNCTDINNNNDCNCQTECDCQNECNCQNGGECTCGDECHCTEECNCHEGCCNDSKEKELTARISLLEDALLRNQAELQNYKKRKDEETAKVLKYAERDILEGFLPILDNFERAISMDDNNFGDETSKFLEGFRMVYNQTKKLLEKFEVKEIDCLGKEFDPAYEQAVVVEKDETKAPGVVLSVLQKGYVYKDRVLRIAMVKVNE